VLGEVDLLVILLKPSPCQGLCDENDPEVEDIGDVIGLCSGQFVSQPADILSQATQTQATQSQALHSQATQSQASYLK
jgi:hypothetical protein